MMLDQSFSVANFRKIIDLENKKGNYLEGEFFPDVEEKSISIQSVKNELRSLERVKAGLSEEKYKNEKRNLSKRLEDLKKSKEDLLSKNLEAVSEEIYSKNFSFGIKEVDIGKAKKVYVSEQRAATFFALKQAQYNFRRLYKVKQANRHQIVCQLRELLGDKFPKCIVRTDISAFYESIPRMKLLKKLMEDPLLTSTSKKIIRRILFEYSEITGSDTGLPRGIGISAYLAEYYLRSFDQVFRDYPGVLYYARYVDDIFIIYCRPPNLGKIPFYRTILEEFKSLELKRNKTKTKIFDIETNSLPNSVEYLGYKFSVGTVPIKLGLTNGKIKRYKQRIDLIFSDYNKKSTMPKRTEKKARALLEKRIRFLTGNTRLVNNKKNVVSGIYFSNSLLTEQLDDLDELDSYLKRKLSYLTSYRLKNRLSFHTFKKGFKTRKFHKFSAKDLHKIVEVWKHV